ncbi:hypothetical protein [Thalassobacillus pellis]|uniref:hypothetical protein n=1 Tax=Thalassobacillus pellis TaxID=748008 RepID=UPI00195F9255|nr:hypothetical protein [Thalassobacillus pellis]MBM7552901.1 hypothetical protein [Thalassobacillus pellis]
MKKRWIYSAVGAIGAGALAYVWRDETKRDQLKQKAKSLQEKWTQSESGDFPVDAAGKPEVDNFENTKMVSEGSQFGVNYYNELTDKEREILEKTNS